MPLPLTVSYFNKIQIGFAFLVPAHPGSPGQRAVKCVCVCVYLQTSGYFPLELCPKLWSYKIFNTARLSLQGVFNLGERRWTMRLHTVWWTRPSSVELSWQYLRRSTSILSHWPSTSVYSTLHVRQCVARVHLQQLILAYFHVFIVVVAFVVFGLVSPASCGVIGRKERFWNSCSFFVEWDVSVNAAVVVARRRGRQLAQTVGGSQGVVSVTIVRS